jgi:hypothetical protein
MRSVFFARAAYASLLVIVAVIAPWGGTAGATDGCLHQPGAQAPEGSHWYYRVDRATNRHCWYLGSRGIAVHRSVSAKPRPATKPKSQAAVETRKETHKERSTGVAAAAVPAAMTSGKSNREGDVFASLWPDRKSLSGPIELDPTLGNVHAEADAITDPQDEMPLIWPVLTAAELAAAAPTPGGLFTPAQLPLLFLGALALAAVVGRVARASRRRYWA